jgi:endonuclease YncB( thermonuclease family)
MSFRSPKEILEPTKSKRFKKLLKVFQSILLLAVAGLSYVGFEYFRYDVASLWTKASPVVVTSVYDGDTFRVGEERIRVLGIDTPERGSRAQCSKEHAMAMEARKFLYDAIIGGTVKVERHGTDNMAGR